MQKNITNDVKQITKKKRIEIEPLATPKESDNSKDLLNKIFYSHNSLIFKFNHMHYNLTKELKSASLGITALWSDNEAATGNLDATISQIEHEIHQLKGRLDNIEKILNKRVI